MINVFFSCLVQSVLLYFRLVLSFSKRNIYNIVIKSLILRVHLTIRRSSENIEPQKIVDVMLLDKWGTRAIKNGNLPLMSNSLYTKTLSSVLMARSKNEAWIPWCSTLSSVSLGYIFYDCCQKFTATVYSTKVISESRNLMICICSGRSI